MKTPWMLKRPLGVAALIVLFAAAVTAIGQTLLSEPTQIGLNQSIPTRGMTMESVEASYGSPTSRRAPVGDPPITRWEYQQFIVYFEYKRVIHSVAKRPAS
ncbi:MAG: hypothetical protein HKO55_06865 [Gammaproteobacteria bacterium]|nr:hypothetical protein [Gammaproteobacteria bacterium]